LKKSIKIQFYDGSFRIFNAVKEYVSGMYFFFLIQEDLETYAFDRKNIINIKRRTYKGWQEVKLKKIKNKS